jgi:hypothetical protein
MRVSLKSAGWDGRHKSEQREALSLCPRVSFRFPLGDNLISVLQLRALTGFVTEGQDIAELCGDDRSPGHICLVGSNANTAFSLLPVSGTKRHDFLSFMPRQMTVHNLRGGTRVPLT